MSRTEDIARVLADPRLTPERVEAYLRANGFAYNGAVQQDGIKGWRIFYRRTGPKSGTWINVPVLYSTDRYFDSSNPDRRMEDVVAAIANVTDAWWLDTAAAILATPLPGDEEGQG